MDRKDFSVGMTVYISPDWRGKTKRLQKATIKKIGRKWVEVEPEFLGRFSIATGEEDAGRYSPTRKLFLDPQLYYDNIDSIRIQQAVHQLLTNYQTMASVSLEQWKAIAEILGAEYTPIEREF